jgi:hypothetical protein
MLYPLSYGSSVSLTLHHIRSIERGAMTARPSKGTGLRRFTLKEHLSRCRTISDDWRQKCYLSTLASLHSLF